MTVVLAGSKTYPITSVDQYSLSLTGFTNPSQTNEDPNLKNGDLVVAIIGHGGATANTPIVLSPSTTQVFYDSILNSYDAKLSVNYFVCGTSPPASLTVTGLGGTGGRVGLVTVLVFRGANTTSPFVNYTGTPLSTAIATYGYKGTRTDPSDGGTVLTGYNTGRSTYSAFFIEGGFSSGTDTNNLNYYTDAANTPHPVIVSGNVSSTTATCGTIVGWRKLFRSTGTGIANLPYWRTPTNSSSGTYITFNLEIREAGGIRYNTSTNINSPNFGTRGVPARYWNGTYWVTKPVQWWNGSAWVTTKW